MVSIVHEAVSTSYQKAICSEYKHPNVEGADTRTREATHSLRGCPGDGAMTIQQTREALDIGCLCNKELVM